MNYNKLAVEWLMCSYLYYIRGEIPPLTDKEFDNHTKLLNEHFDEWELHKDLITREILQVGSAFDLVISDYPSITKYSAIEWLNEIKPN